MSQATISKVEQVASIDGDDIVKGLNNNDELILSFIADMLESAGSSELEGELLNLIKERLGIQEVVS